MPDCLSRQRPTTGVKGMRSRASPRLEDFRSARMTFLEALCLFIVERSCPSRGGLLPHRNVLYKMRVAELRPRDSV